MALQAITSDNILHWICPGGEDEDELCGLLNSVHINAVEYQEAIPGQPRGAVIALPHCTCGTQTFLKADYKLKELYKAVVAITNDQGVTWAHGLRLGHVYNLHTHWLLYQRGKAAHPPVLDMPPARLFDLPQFAGVLPEVVHALWYGFMTVRQHRPQEIGVGQIFAQITAGKDDRS